jgi:hypothetical protein
MSGVANAVVPARRATKPPIAICAHMELEEKGHDRSIPLLDGIQYSRLVPSRLIPSEQLNHLLTRLA